MALESPAKKGPYKIKQIIYATLGLDYSNYQFDMSGYFLFHKPEEGYETGTVDISPFANIAHGLLWPFKSKNVPINGIAVIPQLEGKSPLVLIAHGNHSPEENSTQGYLYLCELFASQGIIAGTIDVNFLNGNNRGENDGRALIHLEHIKQFKKWNEMEGHPLFNKIDLDKIIIIGHSRGGEAVGHASVFNFLDEIRPETYAPIYSFDGSRGLGPYKFNIRCFVAIAPTDRQYEFSNGLTSVNGNYFIMHGSSDGDVWTFAGYSTYDRTHKVANERQVSDYKYIKSLLWIHKANHNYFNSSWQQESNIETLTRDEQEEVAKVYIGAIIKSFFMDQDEYMQVFKGFEISKKFNWLPESLQLVSQFHSKNRISFQHFEEGSDNIILSEPFKGSVEVENIQTQKLHFNLGFNKHLYQETNGIRLSWIKPQNEYSILINKMPIPVNDYSFFACRVAQSFENQNPENRLQNFSIRFEDEENHYLVEVGEYVNLYYPAKPVDDELYNPEPKTVMQTLRVPLEKLKEVGIELNNLKKITFLFNKNIEQDNLNSGKLYIDDIQLTK